MATIVADSATTATRVLDRSLGAGWQEHRRGRHRYGETLSGAAVTVEFLKFCGADVIFGIPGGASLPLSDALTIAHHAGAFRYVLTGHEQGAGFEAEGYAAACGRVGFCTATSGPGATNLITPLADAFRDSRPLIALTGNTATTAEPEAFQGIDIVGITRGKATKASYRANHPDSVQELLVRALHVAVTGRPGSVLVDLPKDVQTRTTVMRPWEELLACHDWSPPRASDEEIERLAERLAHSEKPLVVAGNGVVLSHAAGELRELCCRCDVPAVTTVHGLGVLPAGAPHNLGMVGMHGTMVANLAPYLADVVVVLGARFDDRVVGAQPERFAPDAFVAHVDVDERQLNRVRRVDLPIHGDVRDTLQRLLRQLDSGPAPNRANWHAELAAIRHAMPTPTFDRSDADTLSHEWAYSTINRILREMNVPQTVALFDVGTHQMKGAQWFAASQPRSFITSGGMGTMGAALPMAVGAHFARPDATVLAVCGDGGMVMSSHELDTIGGYGLPIKVLAFDDASLGMVGHQHDLFCAGRKLTSDRRRGRATRPVDARGMARHLGERLNDVATAAELTSAVLETTRALALHEWPLFATQAAAFGIPSERVHDKPAFAAAFRRAMATAGPYFIQVMLPAAHNTYPMIEPGKTPQDIIWRETTPGSGVKVYAREHFDYQSRTLRQIAASSDPTVST